MARYLGVDFGTTNTKVTVIEHGVPTSVVIGTPHGIRTPSDWWDFFLDALRQGVAPARGGVDALCVTATAPDVFVRTESGREDGLRFYSDKAYGIERDLDRQLGTPKWANEVLSKLIFLQRDVREPVAQFFSLHNYIVNRMTGEYLVDTVVAGECGALVLEGAWNVKLGASLGLESLSYPAIQTPSYLVGAVTNPHVAEVVGDDCQVVLGSSDSFGTALGAGLRQEGDVLVYFGTFNSATRIMKSLPDVLTQPSSPIQLFDWFCSLPRSGTQLDGLAKSLRNGDYGSFFASAATSPIGARGVRFVHTPLGFTSTVSTEPRGAYFGLPCAVETGDLARAALEAFAFSLVLFAEAEGIELDGRRAYAAGGGAKQRLWRQIVCDVTGMDLTYTPEADRGLGTAELARAALRGELSDPDRRSPTLRPDPEAQAQYRPHLEDYRAWFGYGLCLPSHYQAGPVH